MNQQDRSRLIIIKALLTLVFCIIAVSAGTDRESDRVPLNDSLFTSSQSFIIELAIPLTATYLQTVIHEIEIPFFKSLSIIRKAVVDSKLARNQVFVLRKLLENTVPRYRIHSYLSILRTHRDDPPDLSQI